MSKHYFHAVIWIDHREARVFHFNPTDIEKLILHPDNLRASTSITKQTLSGADTHRRTTTIFTRSLNWSQTPAQFSSPDQRMQRLNWSSTFTFATPS